MLKIIAGKNRGYEIIFKPSEITRPTASLVKESLFNIIQFRILNSTFLDLFYGSGQIGLESLSRGAGKVTFVDENVYCKKCLEKNLKNMNISNKIEIVTSDVMLYLNRCKDKFDIIFLDPPYNKGFSNIVLNKIVKIVNPYGIIIIETEKNEILDEYCDNFYMYKQYVYGKKKLTVFKNNESKVT